MKPGADLKGLHLLAEHLQEGLLVLCPMRWCLGEIRKQRRKITFSLYFSCQVISLI
jgi:hypothetical protein